MINLDKDAFKTNAPPQETASPFNNSKIFINPREFGIIPPQENNEEPKQINIMPSTLDLPAPKNESEDYAMTDVNTIKPEIPKSIKDTKKDGASILSNPVVLLIIGAFAGVLIFILAKKIG